MFIVQGKSHGHSVAVFGLSLVSSLVLMAVCQLICCSLVKWLILALKWPVHHKLAYIRDNGECALPLDCTSAVSCTYIILRFQKIGDFPTQPKVRFQSRKKILKRCRKLVSIWQCFLLSRLVTTIYWVAFIHLHLVSAVWLQVHLTGLFLRHD